MSQRPIGAARVFEILEAFDATLQAAAARRLALTAEQRLGLAAALIAKAADERTQANLAAHAEQWLSEHVATR